MKPSPAETGIWARRKTSAPKRGAFKPPGLVVMQPSAIAFNEPLDRQPPSCVTLPDLSISGSTRPLRAYRPVPGHLSSV